MQEIPTIALYGATGFTGRLVARALLKYWRAGADKSESASIQSSSHKTSSHKIVLSGRDQVKLARLADELRREERPSAHPSTEIEVRAASVDEPRSLDAMLAGVGVLINCAGPFGDIGLGVVDAAVRNEVYYLDSSGEQAFMKRVQRGCSVDAREQGVVLMPGCAYEYAVGAFAGRLALGLGARRLAVCYAQRNTTMSSGTRNSVLRAISDPGYTFIDGALARRYIGYRKFEVPRPGARPMQAVWFPGGEPLLVPLMPGGGDKLVQVESCLAVSARVAKLLTSVAPLFRLAAGRDRARSLLTSALDRLGAATGGADTVPGTMSSASGAGAGNARLGRQISCRLRGERGGQAGAPTGHGRPAFLVTAFDPDDGHFFASIVGGDPYLVTARILVETAHRLLTQPPEEGGFTSPAALFDPREFLAAVELEVVV